MSWVPLVFSSKMKSAYIKHWQNISYSCISSLTVKRMEIQADKVSLFLLCCCCCALNHSHLQFNFCRALSAWKGTYLLNNIFQLKGMKSSSEEKMAPAHLPLPMGSNFHTLPSKPSKSHMQAVPEYSSHTLTLRREKSRLAGGMDPSCGKPVYVCEGELFKQLDADLAGAQGGGSMSDGSGYVLMPNTTSTLRSKPKDDPTKYNISMEQLPQARLMHLGGPFAEPQAAFGIQSIPPDQVSISFSERDSPIQNIHNMSSESHITHSSLENTFESMNSMMSKSETISTLSMSSLEVRPASEFQLDLCILLHWSDWTLNCLSISFLSLQRQKSRYAELDFEVNVLQRTLSMSAIHQDHESQA